MKIRGKNIEPIGERTVVIPRKDENIVFTAKPVTDYEEFDKLCPQPKPKVITRPGGAQSIKTDDPNYLKELDTWSEQRSAWMFLQALSATEGLEWDTIDFGDPSTWMNYQTELGACGLSMLEQQKIMEIVIEANGLNQDKIDQATQAFLASQRAPVSE